METQPRLFVLLVIQLGVIASIASVLARSVLFKRVLFLEHRSARQKLLFVLYLAFPLASGVFIRLTVHDFQSSDLSLPGTFLIGLFAGQAAGLLGGALVGVLPVLLRHEWLSLVMTLVAGLLGALCRQVAPTMEEIWAFSPFIDLEVWRWLRNRLDRPFRDWQALMFAVLSGLAVLQWQLARLYPTLIYAPRAHTAWGGIGLAASTILAVAIPIKIWNNTRIENKLEEQRRMLVQARLDALTSQINPHFLFNTLNSIASLVRVEPQTARLLIVKLSTILRRLLRKHENYVPLREELQFMDDYLDIEVVRFGPQKLQVVKEVAPEVMELPVPSMLLQPLVENAIRHGLAPRLGGGRIVLRAHPEGRELVVEVEDNGVGIPDPAVFVTQGSENERHGIGLTNVRERLRVLYGDAASLTLRSAPGTGTLITIRLPLSSRAGRLE